MYTQKNEYNVLHIRRKMEQTKVCSKCKEEKSLDEFYVERCRSGRQAYCKPCRAICQKQRREKKKTENAFDPLLDPDYTAVYIPDFPNYTANPEGRIRNMVTGKYLQGRKGDGGYITICLRNEKGRKFFLWHRLLASVFLKDDYSEDLLVDHIDGNRTNNTMTNLRMVTPKGNMENLPKRQCTSKFRGIYCRNGRTWIACLKREDGSYRSKSFSDELVAVKWLEKKTRKLRGKEYRLNFEDEDMTEIKVHRESDHKSIRYPYSDEQIKSLSSTRRAKIPDCPGYSVYENGVIQNDVTDHLITVSAIGKYKQIQVRDAHGKSRPYQLHRLLGICFIENDDPLNKKFVDHIDGNSLNNDISNLRWVTHLENMTNTRKRKRGTSKFQGVYHQSNRWTANIVRNGIKYYLGSFKTEEEASQAYERKKEELDGKKNHKKVKT